MIRKGILAVFEGSNISETGEGTSTKIGVHATLIPTSINFLSQFRLIEFFDDQSMVRKENLVVFEGSNISETRMATPTKIGVHAFDIKLYLYDFFELIPID